MLLHRLGPFELDVQSTWRTQSHYKIVLTRYLGISFFKNLSLIFLNGPFNKKVKDTS